MDLLAIGAIALAFAIWLSLPSRIRKDRREQMGLEPYEPPDWRNDIPSRYRTTKGAIT